MKKLFQYLILVIWFVLTLLWIRFIYQNQLPVEFRLAELGCSWSFAQPLARFLSGFFAATWVTGLITGKKLGWSGIFSWVGLITLTQIIFNQVSHANFKEPMIYPYFEQGWIRYTIYLSILLFWMISRIWFHELEFIKRSKGWTVATLFLLCFGTLFWLRPVYAEDFKEMSAPQPKDVSKQLARVVGNSDISKPVYLFYFSLGCEHCYMMYHRLAASAVAKKPNYQARIIFSGPQEGLKDFLGDTRIPFPATQVLGKEFYFESGPEVPAIFRFQQGRCTGYWLGDGFNFYMLNYLADQ